MSWNPLSLIGRSGPRGPVNAHVASSATSFADLVAAGDRARDTRDWGNAIAYYQAAVAKRPFALGIVVQLGHASKESGYYSEAEACYRAFFEKNPEDADIHLQLGHLFLRQDRAEEARTWYAGALERAAAGSQIAEDARRGIEACANAPVLSLRRHALELTDQRRFDEAYDVLQDLVEQQGCEDLVGILGNVCKECGRFPEAARYYDRYEAYAAAKDPERLFDAAVQKGHLAKLDRRHEDAIGHFARAQALIATARQPSSSSQDLEGEIRACLGQITKAIELR